MTLHVGLNLLFLVPGETGGRETYARELVTALRAEAPALRLTAFLNREAAAGGLAWPALDRTVTVPVHGRRRAQWALGELALVAGAAARARVDLLHSLANFGPPAGPFARVLTVHDLLYRRFPEHHPAAARAGTAVLLPLAARRAHRVITVSRASRDELVRDLGLPDERVAVVPNGLGVELARDALPPAEVRRRFGLGERPVALCPATQLEHKNLGALCQAAAAWPERPGPVWVVAGHRTALEGRLLALASELGVLSDLRLLGRVTPGELEGLYAAASCVVLPTRYEGFGLPVLEAMRRGVPVACSNIPVLQEVAGEAARLFEPDRPAEIVRAVQAVLKDPGEAERLRASGRARARAFSWAASARGTLASYQRALTAARSFRGVAAVAVNQARTTGA